jgi:hypothetical protein
MSLLYAYPSVPSLAERDAETIVELRRFLDTLLGSRLVSAMALAAGSGVDQQQVLDFVGGRELTRQQYFRLDRFLRKYLGYGNPLKEQVLAQRWVISKQEASTADFDTLKYRIFHAAHELGGALLAGRVFTLESQPALWGKQAGTEYVLVLGARPFGPVLSPAESGVPNPELAAE